MSLRARIGVSFTVLILISAVPARCADVVVETPEPAIQAFAQAETTVTQRVKQWTRARLEAAKKRWAHNDAKFSACTNELAEVRKARRLTIHDQGHFLQDCMLRP